MDTVTSLSKVTRRGALMGSAALLGAGCSHDPRPSGQAAAPSDALGDSDGVGLAARIRSGEITAAEALEAAIARAERVQPALNFMATPAYDRARAQAAQPTSGPFAGVPTLIKDLTPLAGVRVMFGSRAYATLVADRNPPYVEALLRAGLNPFGKSTTPEFGYTATTEPVLGGPTRNPWNPAHSSGGSSGGAAAAVAAGVVPVAHASDGGGSIRIPAACCGLVGLKASRGRLIASRDSNAPVDISVDGCVSRTVRDTAAWLAATERAAGQGPLGPVGLVSGPSQRRLRIGLAIADARGVAPDLEVGEAVADIARLCETLGHRVAPITMPFDGEAFAEAFTLYWAAGAAQVTADVSARSVATPIDQLLEPLTLQLADLWRRQPEGTIERVVTVLRTAEAQYASMMQSIDVLLTPVLAKPPVRLGEIAPTLPFDEGFARVGSYVAYTPLQNAVGAPALSLPLAMSRSGLPIGVHFSAATGGERTLLELAYELELARPWADRRPQVFA